MAVLKLELDEFDAIDYNLIAIHSSLENYRMAFVLNQHLPIILHKNKNPFSLAVKDKVVAFDYFQFEDQATDVNWMLLPNKNEYVVRKKSTGQNLFLDTQVEIATRVYLLPEFKKVDYFLKIEHQNHFDVLAEVLDKINGIPQISAVYPVDSAKIKSKNNLIF
jgi:hypothetical protein